MIERGMHAATAAHRGTPIVADGNRHPLLQIKSADGRRHFSIIEVGAGLFRFIEKTEVYEPETPSVPGYWYWEETHRSGLYDSAIAAEHEALAILPWLKAYISN